ncbi:hypothetical protein [Modicisalibacter muralis]|uniref:hypothetical protein n=1 Tax=Modicisalibacter muralis TaxID=119000 RepID=UPI001587CE3D|nr:hypothetical protein [Halomonas muralis]
MLESLRAFEQRNHWGATAMTTQMEEDILTPDDRDFVTALAGGLEVILAFDSDNRA